MFRRLAAWVRYRQELSRERSDARTRAYGSRLRDRMTAAEWADFYTEVDRQRLSNVAASAEAEAEADSIHSLTRVNRIDTAELDAALARSISALRDQASICADEFAYTSRAFETIIEEDLSMDHADEILDEIHELSRDAVRFTPANSNYTYQSRPVRGRTYSGNAEFTINYETSSQELWERIQSDAVQRRVVSSRPSRYYPQQRPPRIPVRPGALHAFDPDTEVKVYEQTEDEVVEIETDIRPDWDYRLPTDRPRFITSEDIW
jgi:hypothetical protein